MDNSQFRGLVQSNADATAKDGGASRAFKKPALGSRTRASIPMTPRSLTGQNASKLFAQQVADQRGDHDGQPPTKKFKSSAPKGSKFSSNYHDRTLARREGDAAETHDDKQKRLKALEEMYKLQQIDGATFENLKNEIGIGGDLSSTHLVKGLDWKLLQRVRQGEDLDGTPEAKPNQDEPPKVSLDEELDQALEKEVQAVAHASEHEYDEPAAVVTQPTTRDEILQRLKQSRGAKQDMAPAEPVLSDRFKKVSSDKSNKKKFVEVVNGRRREVLVVTNKDGTTKRKTRWLDKEEDVLKNQQSQPLGMEVPAELLAKQQALLREAEAEDGDDDIFQGVDDYDPLAGINSDTEDEHDGEAVSKARVESDVAAIDSKPRNYFAASKQEEEMEDRTNPMLRDPTLLTAFKRAAELQKRGGDGEEDVGSSAKQQQMLNRMKEQDRADAADMDFGFGGSRFADEDDEDGPMWDEGDGQAKKPERERGGKKRKGDKDNVSDVMAVLQGREKKS